MFVSKTIMTTANPNVCEQGPASCSGADDAGKTGWWCSTFSAVPDQTAKVPLGECLTPEQRAHREHETVSATRSAATQAARGHTISSMLERRAVSDNNGPKPRLLHEKSAYLVQGRGRSIDGSGTRAGSCGELSLQVVCTAPHQQVNHK